jgi:hypothetical protein
MDITAFSVIAPCSLIEVDQCFRSASLGQWVIILMEAECIFETLVYFETT